MNQIKNERINNLLHKEISYIIANEVKNPGAKYVTVTAVDTSSDLSFAKVYFTTLKDKDLACKALIQAKGYIRKQLADRVEIRHIPELEFVYDESIAYGEMIEKKIEEIHKNDD